MPQDLNPLNTFIQAKPLSNWPKRKNKKGNLPLKKWKVTDTFILNNLNIAHAIDSNGKKARFNPIIGDSGFVNLKGFGANKGYIYQIK